MGMVAQLWMLRIGKVRATESQMPRLVQLQVVAKRVRGRLALGPNKQKGQVLTITTSAADADKDQK